MKKNTLVLFVLGLLLLLSVVQAITLTGLKAKLNDAPGMSLSQSSPATAGSLHSGGNTVASTINDLPAMVGGC